MVSHELQRISVSAPGKVILFGEHAVVHGKLAIASSIDLRTKLTLERQINAAAAHQESLIVHLDLKDLDSTYEWKLSPETLQDPSCCVVKGSGSAEFAARAFLSLFCSLHRISHETRGYNAYGSLITVVVKSEIPVGAGLGSSASYSVCVAAALLECFGLLSGKDHYTPEDLLTINEWAYEAEKVIHGTPSGLDNYVSTYGGLVRYKKGGLKEQLIVKNETLKASMNFLLVHTLVPRNTSHLVSGVKVKMDKYPQIMSNILDAIDGISTKFVEQCSSKDSALNETIDTVADLISTNHYLLNSIDVGHSSLDTVFAIAKKHGFTAKLTGAGGGGCALVYLANDPRDSISLIDLVTSLEGQGFRTFSVKLGHAGLLRLK
ncbi:hypothetical protein MP638_000043 [Amoeboaphelidium occidentale]|nr:hypothetical protein MP638_000043 [Amoeboaphelidium occidentale]